ncbi:hypothetical protein Hanom_Chr01g00092951 [Helianthus anomalus]
MMIQYIRRLETWKGQSLAYERIAWIKIQGVPLHLVENAVFNSVGEKFGKVIKLSQLSKEDDDLSYDCLGILVGDGKPICGEANLKWSNKLFKVWVSEEPNEWILDCVTGADFPIVFGGWRREFQWEDRKLW